ncbi:primosomal protein N' [Terrihabitans sp. B22-R8]|uniref:primosomal protein N' n=1 Tax=Terrihabitans sp. B22-R8 TaxID=3425128 RepID=UPI00403C43EF
MNTAEVLLPVALDRSFTYSVPEGLTLEPGTFVEVPLGPRAVGGVVWGPGDPDVPQKRLKAVRGVLDLPPLGAELMHFVDWVARYTLAPRGMVLRIAVRGARDVGEEKVRRVIMATGQPPSRATDARTRVMAVASDGRPRAKADLAREAGVSPGVIDGLVADGALRVAELEPEPVGAGLDPDHAPPGLSAGQSELATELRRAVHEREASTHLLEGVTGSGKTETYLEAVAEALRAGRQALILLPEIALTKALLDRVTARFGAAPGEWHSTVGARRRARIWHGAATGETRVVIGARSALFLPFRDLGVIVVDEEHDAGFKQDDVPIYHARDMAVVRGRLAHAPVLLVSATPSLESRVNAEAKRYRHHILPERFGGRSMPQIGLLDLRADPPERGRWIAPALENEVRETLGRGEQALLFLNRRGFAPLTLCRACGHRFACPNCTAWLVEHRFRGQLMCHHCGHHEPVPPACPKCGTVDKLAAVGPGVERIRDEAGALFPEARLAVLSSDLITGADQIRAELKAVEEHQVDLVIGTQLVTKGHNFPHLTLVGVVDGDLGLGTSDPRAAERTFQMLEQVTGRAGRGERPGKGIIQTHDPDHPVMQALKRHDGAAFYAAEIAARADALLPPFGRLASLVVSAPNKVDAEVYARVLAQAFPEANGARLLGPAEAPIAILRGRHRIRLLVRAERSTDVSGLIRAWISAAPAPTGSVGVHIDVDPISFL